MTPLDFQDLLAEEIGNILSKNTYMTTDGESVPINIYTQELPIQESDDDADPVPYILVRITDGEDTGEKNSYNTVHTTIIIAIWDGDKKAQGHRDVMGIINQLYQRVHKDQRLGASFYLGNFSWRLQDDNYFPYFIGAVSMDFVIPAIRREDPFS